MDHQSDSTQSEDRHLKQESHAYAGDEHHDESVGQHQSIQSQDHSLMNQNHMSDDWVYEKNEMEHEKKSEAKKQ
jgi:hypothetical protein